jgi:glycosyltransferase involved in cell wall biosynthesis
VGAASSPKTQSVLSAPLVSIVTPTLNRARFLEHTLASVAAQTYRAVEHIVVDGGSTDHTLALLRDWEKRHKVRWSSEPDTGMYDAINKGLALATGEIVAYLNSDDLYFPWTIATIVEAFKQSRDVAFVYGDVLSVDERIHAERIHWQLPFNLDYIRRVGFLAQPAVFWRRELVVREGGFDETLRYVADCDYWMRLGEKHRFQKVNEIVAIERDHAGALRERDRAALESELTLVRSRYVMAEGMGHRLAIVLHQVRVFAWRRAYWLRFAGSRLRTDRRRPWSRFLSDRRTKVTNRWIFALLIPWVGRSAENRVLAGSAWPPEMP